LQSLSFDFTTILFQEVMHREAVTIKFLTILFTRNHRSTMNLSSSEKCYESKK